MFYFYYFLCFIDILIRTKSHKGFVVLFRIHHFETTIRLSNWNRSYCIFWYSTAIALCTNCIETTSIRLGSVQRPNKPSKLMVSTTEVGGDKNPTDWLPGKISQSPKTRIWTSLVLQNQTVYFSKSYYKWNKSSRTSHNNWREHIKLYFEHRNRFENWFFESGAHVRI